MNKKPISESFQELQEKSDPKTLDELNSCFKDIAQETGLQAMTYFTWSGSINQYTTKPLIQTTYPLGWLERYRERRYERIDPVVRHGMNAFLPLDWGSVQDDPEVQKFFGEAWDFGVHRHGLTVPIRDSFNRQALFSVNIDIASREWESFLESYRSDLVYLAFLYHSRFVELSPEAMQDTTTLSKREIAVLQWAANGKTSWETSQILGLSPKTIDFYISNACRKLDVANRTQAVAAAVGRGYITAM